MATKAPTVMVSSTFYDLRQIRQDLASFLEKELGYNALLSEFNSFPVDPDLDTIENCRRRVESDADVLILVIGGRYGFIDKKSNKSVTNLEYLTARAKGIPIYVFVDKSISTLLPIWEENPRAKFNKAVSDTKVFEFIRQVRSIDKVWTFEFEHAQNIVEALRRQFAYLMHEGLQATKRLSLDQTHIPVGVSGKALRLILEKPDCWEHSLFAQVLTDEVNKYSDIREEYRLKLIFSQGESITADNMIGWVGRKMKEVVKLAQVVSELLNTHLQVALGPPGLPGDEKALVFVAKKAGEVYQEAIKWSLDIQRADTRPCLQPVIEELARGADDLIKKVGDFGPSITRGLDEIRLLPEGAEKVLKIILQIDTSIDGEIVDLMIKCLENCENDKLP